MSGDILGPGFYAHGQHQLICVKKQFPLWGDFLALAPRLRIHPPAGRAGAEGEEVTLVAVWKSGQRLNAAADTRIGNSAGASLTEHGPKILPLPISCRQPGPGGDFNNEVFHTTVGFAFAGASLTALSSHALASALCSNLIAPPGSPVPSLHEIANAVGVIGLHYIREVGQHSGDDPKFTAIVFGYCGASRRLSAFELRPIVHPTLIDMTVTKQNLDEGNHVAIIGTSSDELRARIHSLRAVAERDVMIDEAPVQALKHMIKEGVDDRVGGSIQHAFVWQGGFAPMATVKADDPSGVAWTVLGLDVSTAFSVGAYRIGMIGRF
jgi:hypothetical protein